MRKITCGCLAVCLALTFVACGDDDDTDPKIQDIGVNPKPDFNKPILDGPVVVKNDLPVVVKPDINVIKPDSAPPCDPANFGKMCESDGDCDGNTICGKIYSDLPGSCTCLCTPDDPDTPLSNEDSCPNNTQFPCVTHEEAGVSFCAQKCEPKLGANDCKTGVACDPMISALDFGLFDSYICAFGGCTDDAGCQVITAEDCDTAAPACTDATATCLPKASGSTEGLCVLPGKCDVASGLCDAHDKGKTDAKIGDPCTSDLDCAGNMTCFSESANTDGTILFRNGYCAIWGCGAGATLTSKACPADASCNGFYIAGICQKGCDIDDAATCRGNAADYWGDYECRGWNLPQFQTPITTMPVCDFALFDCGLLSSIGLECGMLSNSTDTNNVMACRGWNGNILANPASPDGYCFDTTASGTMHRGQTPTPDAAVPAPDAGTPDA